MSIRGELHLTKNGAAEIFPLTAPRLTIGRGEESSLRLLDPVISRSHAEIIRLGDDFLLRDLGSTNGCFVNGTRVSEQMLNDGDVVRFGKAGPELLFKETKEVKDGAEVPPTERPRSTNLNDLIQSLVYRLNHSATDEDEKARLRCLLAEAYLNKGLHKVAFDVLAEYADPARLLALPMQPRIGVLFWLGCAHLERKQYDLALEVLQRSLNLYSKAADETGMASAHTALGRALVSAGDLLAARDNLHRALLLARRVGNARLIAEAHLWLGKIDWKEGDLDGARYNWTRAARFSEGTTDRLLQARVQLQQAYILYSEGKFREAAPAYQAIIDQLEKIGNAPFLLKAYSSLARVLTRLGSWAASERLLKVRLNLARDNGLLKAEAVALTDMAELKLLKGDFSTAWDVIRMALDRHGGTVYARTQRILGRLLSVRGQRPEATEELISGLRAARAKGNLEEQILTGLELALTYLEAGDTAQAQAQLDEAESITSLDPALNLMARALYTRGRIHAANNQLPEANRCFTQSLSIFQTIGDPFRAGLCHTAIGDLRARMRRYESARAHLEEAQQIFVKLGAASELPHVEELLASKNLRHVKAAMTLNVPAGLPKTAPLSMASSPTLSLELSRQQRPPRILVAEPSDELASLITHGLEVENYLVDRVHDGRLAREHALARKRAYQLIILDALLEHASGFDVCRELRQRKFDTPIILLGGRQGVEDKIEALQAGADDFVGKKNLVFEELLAKMEALLR
jgi:CheY-like chemotaxis protein